MKLNITFNGPIKNTLLLLGIVLVFTNLAVCKKRKGPACSVCKTISENFYKGLESTAKSNYGGGNTKWEEKSLGSYATSEIRMVEVLEKLCESSSKECHSLVEEHEELVERFWFKEFAKKKDTDFFSYVCIEHLKACCPNNTYGPECLPCPGGVDRPCNENGQCDGEGTRGGSGKCSCNSGYQGDTCTDCKDGFFEDSRNDTHTVCKVCHISCKHLCSEEGPKGCDECKEGWLENEELGCQDINECETAPCEEEQYCTNTQGSYSCFSCDVACDTCTGAGPKKCKECRTGFTMVEASQECVDDDECEADSSLCTGENEICKNAPGSYDCVCQTGFIRKEGACVPASKDPESESGAMDDDDDGGDAHEEESESSVKEEL